MDKWSSDLWGTDGYNMFLILRMFVFTDCFLSVDVKQKLEEIICVSKMALRIQVESYN